MKTAEDGRAHAKAPPRRGARRLRLVAMALTLVLIGAGSSWAQGGRDYRDGKKAAEAGRWSEVEQKMRAAIAKDPEARRKAFSRYTPYYYLGVSLAEQEDCRGALEAWRQTDRYGALKAGGEEAQDMARRQQRCTKLVNDVKVARAQATQSVEKAEEAAESLARLSRHQTLSPLWGAGSPSFAARGREADGLLAAAKAKIDPADGALDLDGLAEAARGADEAGRRFEQVIADAEVKLGELNESIRGAMGELDKAERSALNLLKAVRRVAPYPQKLGSQVSKLRRVLAKAERERNAASAEQLETLTEELIKETMALRPLAARPPSALLDAGAAYLANDYQGVLDLLVTQSFGRQRERYQAGLLQAAAIHGLYVMSGEQDSELLARAQTLIRQLAEMDPGLGTPGERFFSPRFRGIFDEITRAVALERQEAEQASGSTEASGLDEAAAEGAAGAGER